MHSSEWIEWKWSPEKTYPETLDTKVYVRLRNSQEFTEVPLPVSHWYSESPEQSSWFLTHSSDDLHGEGIVAYRVAT